MSQPTVAPSSRSGIVARSLNKSFASLPAVRSLDLEIAPGEIYGLVGPDGAGKTTTLRMIAGLSRPTSGEIWVQGRPVSHRSGVTDDLGYMPQRFGLYADLTVGENLAFYADLRGLAAGQRREREEELLAMTRMTPFRDRPAGKLSGGMKQKLALCCSLLHEPAVLVLDEPTNGVDPVSRRDFWKLLRSLSRRGLTILLATAYMDEAERCHRVGLMAAGRLIVEDSPDDLIGRYRGRCYQVPGKQWPPEGTGPQIGGKKWPPQRTGLQIGDATVVRTARRTLLFLDASPGPDWEEIGSDSGLTPAEPSLEDVFVLLGSSDRNEPELVL